MRCRNNHVVIIDVQSIAYAVFHAMGDLDLHGRKTGIIYGFFYQLLKLAQTFETNQFIFCWDSRKSIRKLIYPGYKNRPKNNTKQLSTGEIIDREAFYNQLDDMRLNWLPSLGFQNSFLHAGLEADDLIALTIEVWEPSKKWPKDIQWVIASTDKDLYQLLRHNVSIYANKKVFTEKDFIELYGINPENWTNAKALGGCNSDTVAGISGIADPAKSKNSRALKYLRGELTGTFLERIESVEGRRIYKRNLKLVNLPIVRSVKHVMRYDTFRLDDFIDMFDALDFRSFLKKEMLEKWISYFGLNR